MFEFLHRIIEPADLVQRVREPVGFRVGHFGFKRERAEGGRFIPAHIVEHHQMRAVYGDLEKAVDEI